MKAPVCETTCMCLWVDEQELVDFIKENLTMYLDFWDEL